VIAVELEPVVEPQVLPHEMRRDLPAHQVPLRVLDERQARQRRHRIGALRHCAPGHRRDEGLLEKRVDFRPVLRGAEIGRHYHVERPRLQQIE
jgi:hypothetical protein